MGAGQSTSVDHDELLQYARRDLTTTPSKRQARLAAGFDKENQISAPASAHGAKDKPRRGKCKKCSFSFNQAVRGQCPMCGEGYSELQKQLARRGSVEFDFSGQSLLKKREFGVAAAKPLQEKADPDMIIPEELDVESLDDTEPSSAGNEIEQKFPYKEGWRFLTKTVDKRTGTVVVHVNNKKTGQVRRFVSGASSSKVAATISCEAAKHAGNIVRPMIMSEKAAHIAAHVSAVTEGVIKDVAGAVELAVITKKRLIQERVLELIAKNEEGIECNLIEVDLPHSTIQLKEQVKFEGGKAVIKPESNNLMQQLAICKSAITRTCVEFGIPNMGWRVEGHTAKSKKSTDGGMATSMARARAVCEHMGKNGIDVKFLFPVGCGCFNPPSNPKADPRRVEVHVMTAEEMATAKAKRGKN